MPFDKMKMDDFGEAHPRLSSFGARKLMLDLDPAPEHRPVAAQTVTGLSKAEIITVHFRPESHVVTVTDPRSPGADRLRLLRMRLRQLRSRATLQVIVVTSALPGDGKSTISLSLATAMAGKGNGPVLLIEADLHKPSIAKTIGIAERRGLAECLEAGLDPLQALQFLNPVGLYLMQAGTTMSSATELVQSDVLNRTLERLKPHFEWILIDSPPIAPLSDALALSEQADGTLLVVRAGQTPRDAVEDAVSKLGPQRIAAIVFNGAEELNELYSKYAGYYRRP